MNVIIGVLQISLLLKGLNGLFFRDYTDFLFEFIAQLIFMCLLFGYMAIIIYIKWGIDWSEDPSKAPSIISQLLMIFLNMGSARQENNKTPLFHKDIIFIKKNFNFILLV